MKDRKRHNGMTLLELLIVMGIIVIMVSMVFIATRGGWVDANTRLTRSTMSVLDGALEDYKENNTIGLMFPIPNCYPTIDFNFPLILYPHEESNSASLYAQLYAVPESRKAIERLDISQVNLDKKFNTYSVFFDAWGTPLDYRYQAGMSYPMIVSAGPDKNFTTLDDNITNRK